MIPLPEKEYPYVINPKRAPGNPHNVQGSTFLPEGWLYLSAEMKAEFDKCGGYGNLIIVDGEVTGFVPDAENPVAIFQGLSEQSEIITKARDALCNDDYKIIKAYEASISGAPAPYNMDELTEKRNKLREAINTAEAATAKLQQQLQEYYQRANANPEAYK